VTEPDIDDFFIRYGRALATGDLPAIGGAYAYPSLEVTRRGNVVIADAAEMEARFDGEADRSAAAGMTQALPTVLGASSSDDGLRTVDVSWNYRDDHGHEKGADTFRYVLVDTEAGPRIAVVLAGAFGERLETGR